MRQLCLKPEDNENSIKFSDIKIKIEGNAHFVFFTLMELAVNSWSLFTHHKCFKNHTFEKQ